jgi:hypothetical protein
MHDTLRMFAFQYQTSVDVAKAIEFQEPFLYQGNKEMKK